MNLTANPKQHNQQVKALADGGRNGAAAIYGERESRLDFQWSTAAIEGELKTIRQRPHDGINQRDSVFWVSLVKIASIIAGSGKQHFTADQTLQLIITACRDQTWITEREIKRQWRNAQRDIKPRFRQGKARGAGSANALLGNTAIYLSASKKTGPIKLSKWRLQDIARQVISDDYRTTHCLVRQVNGSTGLYENKDGKHYYKGLMTCGSIWACPVCALKIAAQRKDEITQALTKLDCNVVLVTLTIQHSIKDKLEILLGDLRDALTHTMNGRPAKRFYSTNQVIGEIRGIEIRRSLVTGWHPHTHRLLLLEKSAQPNIEDIKQFYMSRYGKRLSKKGYTVNEHTIDVRMVTRKPNNELSDYLTKSVIDMELTAGQFKSGASMSPFQLLAAYEETNEEYFADLYREYVDVTRGKRWINFTHRLKKMIELEQESDEEIAGQDEGKEDDKLKLILSEKEWDRVCTNGLRGVLVSVANAGNSITLYQWLYSQKIIVGESDILVPVRPSPS